MNRLRYKLLYLFCLLAMLNSCKESFNPKVTEASNNLLVVEGIINTGADSTIIKLSRTAGLTDVNAATPEVGATVSIESEVSEEFLLKEKEKGTYVTPPLNLNANKKYRLKIRTSKNTIYQSDFVQAKESPPIDDLNWKIGANGLQVYINTHDAANKTRYYRWEYTETWMFNARFESLLRFDGVALSKRNDNIFLCWATKNSSTVLLGSTVKLDQDVIFESPLTLMGFHAERLGQRYSILVKQYAITKEAHQFYEELKKNTETLGSIFDAQPSEIKGNIHNVNGSNEPVIGYISAGTMQQRRIYISKNDLPPSFFLVRTAECTVPDIVSVKRPEEYAGFWGSGQNIPIDYATGDGPGTFISSSTRACADCTFRGTNKQPAFWQ